MTDQLVHIGYIIKPHGLRGAVKAKIDLEMLREIPGAFFISTESKPIPYFITEFSAAGKDIAVIQFESLSSKEDAAVFSGREIFAQPQYLQEVSGNFDYLIGFDVIDTNYGKLGEIEDIITLPQQQLAQIIYNKEKEVLFPLNKEIILETDKKNKLLKVNLPKGLLEI